MKLFLAIMTLGIATAHADSVRVTWAASPSSGVAGYRVYYGTNSGVYAWVTNAGLTLEQAIEFPWRGRWFLAATAYDTNGVESLFSNEAQWEARPQPPAVHGQAVVRLCPVIERSTNLVDWSARAGEPTFFTATNRQEFFRTTQLRIEAVNRLEP